MTTITPSKQTKIIKIFQVVNDKLIYRNELTVLNAEINIDIEAPVNSILTCVAGNAAEGDFALYIDDRFSIPMSIVKVNLLENTSNIELIANSYIDMLTLPIVADDAGNVNYEAGNKKVAKPIDSMNLARANYVYGFDKVSNFYKFEGTNQSVVVEFDDDSRSTTERNILATMLKGKKANIEMSLKLLNAKTTDITSEDYYLSINISSRDDKANIWPLKVSDTELIKQYKIVYSNVEYNCLQLLGEASGAISFYYINADGSQLRGYTLPGTKPPGWMTDAKLPLKIKTKYAKPQDDVTVRDEALAALSDQYLNHEITLTINLDSKKISYKDIYSFIYKSVYFIDLTSDMISRLSYITSIKYNGGNTMEVTLGHNRTGLIKNIRTK